MICPKCNFAQPDGDSECARCGVIFAKIHTIGNEPETSGGGTESQTGGHHTVAKISIDRLKGFLLSVEREENRLPVAGRAIVYALLLVWGWRLTVSTIQSNYVGESFMHLVNLPFHEAGHIFFSPFGRFIQVLGGTLGQWLIPCIVLGAFVARANRFGAMVALWWLGESFLDIAPYMDDARAGQLVLLGGVTGSEVEDYHDWEVLLTRLGWLQYDHLIARISFGIGTILMMLSLVWGGYILWRQWGCSRR